MNPRPTKAILMMRGIASMLEKHHKVQVLDEAIEAAVNLSARYIPARQLPDKSVSVSGYGLRAGGRVSQHAVPAEVDDSRRRIEALDTELGIIDRDETAGYDVTERRTAITGIRAEEETRLAGLTARWEAEKAVVDEILALRAKLREGGAPVDPAPAAVATSDAPAPEGASPLTDEQRAALTVELRAKNAELTAMQGDTPLILPIVDAMAVGSVVGDWTGIPVGRMLKDELQTVIDLAKLLAKRVIGQDHAMEMIAKRIQTARAGSGQSVQADWRVHAGGDLGRRQDRDGAGAGRGHVWRRAERHHHQHERVSGGAYGFVPERCPARLYRLWRGWCADRGGAAQALFGGAAGRGRKGPPRCARNLLSGL